MKKGFTLIELLGVLIILAVIALITFPVIDNSIKSSREQALERTIDSIEEAAYQYSIQNDLGYPTDKQPLYITDMQTQGFLDKEIINPVNNEILSGCVWYYWDTTYSQYSFEYDKDCVKVDTEPEINITYNEGLINSNGWAKENIAVTLIGNGEVKYCLSSSECEPNEVVENGSNTKFITSEGTSYICATTTNTLGTSNRSCQSFNLDKTAPTINGLMQITVERNEEADLNTGVTTDDNLSGVDGTYTINPSSVDTSTAGIKTVTYTVKDLAGNTVSEKRTIQVEGELPTIVFKVEGNPFNSNNWSKENVTVRINVTDNSGLGIKEIKYCKGTAECEPNTLINNNESVILEENSASNQVCVLATDNNETSNKICSNNYQIDKILPTINGVGDIIVNRNEVVDLSNDVTYSDELSQIDGELTITPTTVDTSVTGVKEVRYSVKDKAGNVREVVRRITVDADAPSIVFNLVDSSAINSNGWAKKDFYIRATITDNSGSGIKSVNSCTTNSSSECTPSSSFTGTTKDFLITTEGSNRACVEVTDNNNKTTKVCSDTYNLDKTVPTAGTATFGGTLGSNNWYISNVTVNVANGSDSLSGHSSTTSSVSSITSNTASQTVTITTTDKAGNTATRNYTIKVDKNAPTLTAKSGTVEIKEGASNAVANYFTVSYSISGGSISCTPTNTSSLAVGSRTLSCTATGGNGKTTTATKAITVKANEYEDTTGANKPELASNMIPIKYNGSNWVYADISEEWYDYNSKEWANAVVLNSGVSKSVGQTISESEIALWYVWIPRYKYQLFNANNGSVAEQLINVTFESGTASTGTVSCSDAISGSGSSSQTCTNATNGNWYTHPAFTFGSEQVSGFWVGKFEVSGSTSKITVKPEVQSLRGTTVSAFFTAIQNIKTIYSLSGDSHMMKNMEWGAVAYLKQSSYGLGTTDIGTNNNSNFTTGCGAAAGSSSSRGCNAYNTANGMLASTTGNIYGVYDMSGGAWEYVMGNMVNRSGTFYPSSAGFSSAPNAKYYDKYTYSTSSSNHGRGKLGDATKETSSSFGGSTGGWYSDYAFFVYSSDSWFIRGGSYLNRSSAGVFDFDSNTGGAIGSSSARAVLIP